MRLPWKYCECGCKSSVLEIGGLHFSLYNDLQGGYFLSEQHGARTAGTKYGSIQAASEVVRTHFAPQKSLLLRQVAELTRYMNT